MKKENKNISSKRDIFIPTSKRDSYLITLWNSNNVIINNNKIVINNVLRVGKENTDVMFRERDTR